ncbi:holo-ACP synthase [Williamsoniiplasma luminosum]|uniref:ACP synthase n=1 Tax=Williamsoniiplasma luminosum TaxID=214888 RepID=A0A2S0NJ60_9MOLU|nr:4'-phosphopantetheinyl transferase superfamily protein [Williamsoniiplasma luminosum]AVP49044.1 MAG: ACP synthase [Williamsoniiplasma luminosum]
MNKVGIDIIENSRIKIEQNFLNKILTQNEIKYLDQVDDLQRKIEFTAGRWAVKEAIWKVISVEKRLAFHQIEIGYDPSHRPVVLNSEFANIAISISHEKHFTVAIAMEN